MENRKCLNCGGTLKKGSYICEYCGTDWSPTEPIGPGSTIPVLTPATGMGPVAPAQAKPWQTLLFILLLFFCGPFALVYMWAGVPWSKKSKAIITLIVVSPLLFVLPYGCFYETIYAVRMDGPKYSADAPSWSQRPAESFAARTVYQDLRQGGDRPLSDRKATWKEKYEGRWVVWKGEVLSVNIYQHSESELKLRIDSADPFTVEVSFDPLQNESLQALAVGDKVAVSGRLWGFYFLGDIIRLSDGLLAAGKK